MDKILYSIHREDMDNELWLVVNSKKYWEENRCQSDRTPQEVFDFLDGHNLPFGEVMDGVIEIGNKDELKPASKETEAKLSEILNDSDMFELNDEFSNFCKECCTP